MTDKIFPVTGSL